MSKTSMTAIALGAFGAAVGSGFVQWAQTGSDTGIVKLT
jgi:hypothetical protein